MTSVPELVFEQTFSNDETILQFGNKLYFVTESHMKEGSEKLEEFLLSVDYKYLHAAAIKTVLMPQICIIVQIFNNSIDLV
jgi:hypothetical protein